MYTPNTVNPSIYPRVSHKFRLPFLTNQETETVSKSGKLYTEPLVSTVTEPLTTSEAPTEPLVETQTTPQANKLAWVAKVDGAWYWCEFGLETYLTSIHDNHRYPKFDATGNGWKTKAMAIAEAQSQGYTHTIQYRADGSQKVDKRKIKIG